MKLEITPAQFGTRPPVTKPIPEFLIEVGEERLRQLISDHYDLLRTSDISHLFPTGDEAAFAAAKKHAADFFIQICGGPAYFNQSRGAPQMVGRHAPFRIDMHARERWLGFYRELLPQLEAEGITVRSLESFWNYLDVFSIWMVNTPDNA